MKVLLIKDVYKLGHAGDVKKVADGFGRNFLLPQGLAVLATPGAMKTIEKIRAKAAVARAALNQEMGGLAEQIEGVELQFASKAGETGKLYGSVTSQMIVDALNKKVGTTLEKHFIEIEPIRNLGEHIATVRLTIDLTPKIKVLVYREGETPTKETAKEEAKVVKAEEQVVEVVVSAETEIEEEVITEVVAEVEHVDKPEVEAAAESEVVEESNVTSEPEEKAE